MSSSSSSVSLTTFEAPTVADIPGLLPSDSGMAESANAPQRAASSVERPADYGDARAMLDFIGRMGERLRAGAQRFVNSVVPQIQDAYKSMHVELDRLQADLDETRTAIDMLRAGGRDASERAAGDGYVELGPPADEGRVFDETAADAGYELVRKLAETLARAGSEQLNTSIERIELGYLALENDLQAVRVELQEAQATLAELSARDGVQIASPDAQPAPPDEADASHFGLSAAQVAFFEENGYVGPITLCSPREMARIRRWIDRSAFMHRASPIYASGSPRGSAEARDWHLLYPEIYDLCTHPAMVAVMEALLGPDLILWRSQFMRKEAGANALAWHQDGSLPGGKMRPAVDPVKTVSAWLAIDSAQVDNGCVWVVPGTHREPLEYERKAADRGQGLFHRGFEVQYAVSQDLAVPMVLQPGQFMVFDCQTLHGSTHNPSHQRRLGLAARYTSADVKVYEAQDEDGQGYALDRFGCVLVHGEDRYGHNIMAEPPVRA